MEAGTTSPPQRQRAMERAAKKQEGEKIIINQRDETKILRHKTHLTRRNRHAAGPPPPSAGSGPTIKDKINCHSAKWTFCSSRQCRARKFTNLLNRRARNAGCCDVQFGLLVGTPAKRDFNGTPTICPRKKRAKQTVRSGQMVTGTYQSITNEPENN